MKKSVLCLLLFLLTFCCAAAEETFDPPQTVGVSGDEYIYRFIADNGQTLYFASRETDPYIQYQDVNFDGVPDITILTTRGASNFFFTCFVSVNGEYQPVSIQGSYDELINFQLHPEKKRLSTYAQNGYAGALFEKIIYQWEGTDLLPIRKATSEEYKEASLNDATYTLITHLDQLHVTFRDYQDGTLEGVVYHETVLPLSEVTAVTFDEWMNILWQDL